MTRSQGIIVDLLAFIDRLLVDMSYENTSNLTYCGTRKRDYNRTTRNNRRECFPDNLVDRDAF